MKVVADENIPFLRGLLEDVAEVAYLPGGDIGPAEVRDADALIVRTRTKCDSRLLDGSRCRFIATATIGTDHIDLPYCQSRGITVANAPGCNAPGVAQYVFSAIGRVYPDVRGLTIGVVGVGNVGSIVERWARSMGMRVLLCDPPRARREGDGLFTTLDVIAREADIVTFHTPLTASGEDATYHLADRGFFQGLQRTPLIINAARGGVIDEEAALEAPDLRGLVIDCWEGEPQIDRRLLSKALFATPHIAGYSYEGKVRATRMAVDALTCFFGLPRVTDGLPLTPSAPSEMTVKRVVESYDIEKDTALMKAVPDDFEKLRNSYDYRREA